MTLPLLTPLVAFIYFGWLWNNRSATDLRRVIGSARLPKKAKPRKSYPFLHAASVVRSAEAKLAGSPHQPEPSVAKLLRHGGIGTVPICEERKAPGLLLTSSPLGGSCKTS
jgi:hypothetical protein